MQVEKGELAARGASYAYDIRPVVRAVSLTVRRGEMLALAGPNGSGKTTLLRLLSGSLRATSGTVTLDSRPITLLPPRARARRIAVVPQRSDAGLMLMVHQVVAMGRTPYLGHFGALTSVDRGAVAEAMEATDTSVLAERRFDELSGGEQQRVMLAMSLAQGTDFLLLDEPTVHLDLQHQHELLELLVRLHRARNIGILAVLHDLNLAALHFQRMALLDGGKIVADAAATEVVREIGRLGLFRAPLTVVEHPQAGVPQILLNRTPAE